LLDTEAFAFHRTAPFLRKVRRKLAYIMALFTGGRSVRQNLEVSSLNRDFFMTRFLPRSCH
ncbi:hypothetical protein ACFPAA_09635, partial [Paraburkholderia caffeinitolerans]